MVGFVLEELLLLLGREQNEILLANFVHQRRNRGLDRSIGNTHRKKLTDFVNILVENKFTRIWWFVEYGRIREMEMPRMFVS